MLEKQTTPPHPDFFFFFSVYILYAYIYVYIFKDLLDSSTVSNMLVETLKH